MSATLETQYNDYLNTLINREPQTLTTDEVIKYALVKLIADLRRQIEDFKLNVDETYAFDKYCFDIISDVQLKMIREAQRKLRELNTLVIQFINPFNTNRHKKQIRFV
jgi:hypothetical protein